VGSVLLDRFCNLFVLVLFVCFSIVLAYVLQLDRSSGFAVFILVAIAAFFLGGLVFINADKFLDRFCNQLFWQKVCWLTKNFRSFISNPSYLTQGLAYGFLWHLLTVLALYAFANAVGLNINFIHFLTVTPIALLLILVPISVAGWGVREGVLVFLLGLLGAPKEQVLAMSLIFGIVQLITRITGMILWAATPTDRRTLKKNTAEKENG
jgi:uncharacterized membrane protein YbhN (UPF0104 family)